MGHPGNPLLESVCWDLEPAPAPSFLPGRFICPAAFAAPSPSSVLGLGSLFCPGRRDSLHLDLLWVLGVEMHLEASGKSLQCWSKGVFCGVSSFAEGGRCGCCFPKAGYLIYLSRAGTVMTLTVGGSQHSWQTLILLQCPVRTLLSFSVTILVWPLTFAGVLQRDSIDNSGPWPGYSCLGL